MAGFYNRTAGLERRLLDGQRAHSFHTPGCAATRLLRVLGFATDTIVLVHRLRCYGCPPCPPLWARGGRARIRTPSAGSRREA